MKNNTGTKKLKTAQLTLRKMRLTDFRQICKWFCAPEIAEFSISKKPPTKYEVLRFVIYKLRRYGKPDFYSWGMEYNGKIRGFIELLPTQEAGVYFVSAKLDMSLKSKGLTTQALNAVIEYMKSQDIKYIIGECDKRNVGSARVMEKCGMQPRTPAKGREKIIYKDASTGEKLVFTYNFQKRGNSI